MTSMSTDVREEVRKLAEKLPPNATWDQVMYEIYVRQKIAEGERAIAEGRTVDHEEVRKQFGLD
jgi:predicted transcriptional regulator